MMVFCDKLFKVQNLFNRWVDEAKPQISKVFVALKSEDELVVVVFYESTHAKEVA